MRAKIPYAISHSSNHPTRLLRIACRNIKSNHPPLWARSSNTQSLCRSKLLGSFAADPIGASAFRRFNSTSSTNHPDKPVDDKYTRIARILELKDDQSLDPLEFINHLPRLSHSEHASLTGIILLATPRLAYLLDEGSDFLRRAFQHVYGAIISTDADAFNGKAFLGVVDKLPGRWQIEEQKVTPIEGLAVLILSPSSIRSREAHNPDQLPLFQINSRRQREMPHKREIGGQWFSVPMANTLFINGRQSTFFELAWTPSDLRSAEDFARRYAKRISLRSVALLGRKGQITASGPKNSAELPLIPLTPARPVRDAVGNVVREIEIDNNVVPASQELEDAVMQAVDRMKANGKPIEKAEVFALIKSNSYVDTSSFSQSILYALESGARLHKVTGGGGGWGQKRGLLSLDPETAFDEASDRSDEVENGELLEGLEHDAQPDAAVAVPGDTVEFFLYVNPSDQPHTTDARTKLKFWSEAASEYAWQALGGTIPVQDQLTNVANPESNTLSGSLSPVVHGDMFGLLSERGMAYRSRVLFQPKQRATKGPSTWNFTKESASKIDVPNSYLFVGALRRNDGDLKEQQVARSFVDSDRHLFEAIRKKYQPQDQQLVLERIKRRQQDKRSVSQIVKDKQRNTMRVDISLKDKAQDGKSVEISLENKQQDMEPAYLNLENDLEDTQPAQITPKNKAKNTHPVQKNPKNKPQDTQPVRKIMGFPSRIRKVDPGPQEQDISDETPGETKAEQKDLSGTGIIRSRPIRFWRVSSPKIRKHQVD